jgi:hypothetical protein
MPIVYAWKIKEGLCRWAEAERTHLYEDEKPTPEATKSKCFLMEYKKYLKIRKDAKKEV